MCQTKRIKKAPNKEEFICECIMSVTLKKGLKYSTLGRRYPNVLLLPRNGALAGKCSAKCQVVTFTARWWQDGVDEPKISMVPYGGLFGCKGCCRVPKKQLLGLRNYAEYVWSQLGLWSHTIQDGPHLPNKYPRSPPGHTPAPKKKHHRCLSRNIFAVHDFVRRIGSAWISKQHQRTIENNRRESLEFIQRWLMLGSVKPSKVSSTCWNCLLSVLLNHFRPMNPWRPLRFLQDSAWHQLGIAGPPSLRLRSPSNTRQNLFPSEMDGWID